MQLMPYSLCVSIPLSLSFPHQINFLSCIVHLHKKFFKGKEEGEKWDSAVKKMNAHTRYRRSAALKEGPKNDPVYGSNRELFEAN